MTSKKRQVRQYPVEFKIGAVNLVPELSTACVRQSENVMVAPCPREPQKGTSQGFPFRIKKLMRREGIYIISKRRFKAKKAFRKMPEGVLNLQATHRHIQPQV